MLQQGVCASHELLHSSCCSLFAPCIKSGAWRSPSVQVTFGASFGASHDPLASAGLQACHFRFRATPAVPPIPGFSRNLSGHVWPVTFVSGLAPLANHYHRQTFLLNNRIKANHDGVCCSGCLPPQHCCQLQPDAAALGDLCTAPCQ